MKKYFVMAASAALVLSSCSNEIEQVSNLENNGKKEIKVSTYTPGLTRADEAQASDVQNNGFWMIAEAAEINNRFDYVEDAEGGASSWKAVQVEADLEKGTDAVYKDLTWPGNSTVDFYALYWNKQQEGADRKIQPFELNEDNQLVFSKDNNLVDGQSDIMTAFKSAKYTDTEDGEVTLKFNHILAEVSTNLQIASSASGVYYFAKKVVLVAPTNRTYSFSEEDGGSFSFNEESDTLTTAYTIVDGDMTLESDKFNQAGSSVMVLPGLCKLIVTVRATDYASLDEDFTREVEEIELTQGYNHVLNLTISPETHEMKVNVEVSEWQNADPVEEEI